MSGGLFILSFLSRPENFLSVRLVNHFDGPVTQNFETLKRSRDVSCQLSEFYVQTVSGTGPCSVMGTWLRAMVVVRTSLKNQLIKNLDYILCTFHWLPKIFFLLHF